MSNRTAFDRQLRRDFRIAAINCYIVDLPTKRIHSHSGCEMTRQSYLIVSIETNHGVTGYGEAATAGGPWWSGDSIETIKKVIDENFAPYLIGANPLKINAHKDAMNRIAFRNSFAKASVEMALLDLAGKAASLPVYELFGGSRRSEFEIVWPLGIGDPAAEIDEAEGMVSRKIARNFKVKMGRLDPKQDMQRLTSICAALTDKASISVDLNGSWDEVTFARMAPQFSELGILLIEQPVAAHTIGGAPGFSQRSTIPIMADEGVYGPGDALELANNRAASALSIKLMKTGGFFEGIAISEIARAKGLACFGGCFLEGRIGTLANMHLGSTLKELSLGCEWVGPLLLADDVCETEIEYSNYRVHLPQDIIGLGVEIDPDKMKEYTRV